MDKYDEAIAYLTENPELMGKAWAVPYEDTAPKLAQAHCLFRIVDNSETFEQERGSECGCITQVKCGAMAATSELAKAIFNDNRIPSSWTEITVAHLPIFAEWQRRIDKELNRV